MTNASGPTATGQLEAVVFDVNETLTDLTPLKEVFTDIGLDRSLLRWWFAVLLRDGFALAASGDPAKFSELALTALYEVGVDGGHTLPEGAGELLLAAFAKVPLHPDVSPSLDKLHAAGVRAFALTNGSAAPARQILEAGGVLDSFAEVLSVDDVGHWKPRSEAYELAIAVAGVAPSRLAMVAVHPWDLHGASCAGFSTGWVNREQRSYPGVFRSPTVQSHDLVGVVERLLSLEHPVR
ncbi:MAG: haloacid dehalogenase type II [Acidimicrobiaceae bacterium]|nr:haloacid dehalogenase type II [Acidimicrobiaceae bacterium]